MRKHLAIILFLPFPLSAAPPSGPRYPADLALDPEGRWIFTANEEAGSVSVLDAPSGLVLDELQLSPRGRPHSISVKSGSGGSILLGLSETFIHRVAFVAARRGPEARPVRLELLREIDVGRLPAGLIFTENPARLLVACEGEGEVWEIDARELRVTRRISAVEGAKRLAMGRAGRAIVSGRTAVAEIDLSRGSVLARLEIAGGKALNIDGLAADGAQVFLAHQVQPTEVGIDPQMIAWGLILSNRVTVLPLESFSSKDESVIPLDLRYRAAGDPSGVAIAPGGQAILVTSAGTNRLLFAALPEGPGSRGQPLAADAPVPDLVVGRRPVAVRVAPDGKKAYVACYLDDAVVEVDLEQRKALRALRLGPPPAATPEHLGASVFYSSDRSRGGWYSCHSCHPEGGTAGHNFDTPSDGMGLAKRSPPLRGTLETGPWSWLGRFETLEHQVASSLEKTMAVDKAPSRVDVERVVAFLRSLPAPDSLRPGEDLGGDARRGEELFRAANCVHCHSPPAYTSRSTYDLGTSGDPREVQYNPPSLRGARDRYRYLHDGRALDLKAVFRQHNPRGLHGKASELSDAELADLIAFLKTL
jgi:DNA-binding beta-propeller fold protein YncE